MQFSDRLFKDTVTFDTATDAVGVRGGVAAPPYVAGPTRMAYVETQSWGTNRIEGPEARPLARTRFRIYTKFDPNTGLSRPLRTDDRCTWVDDALAIQLYGPPVRQGPLWLTEGERAT